MRLHHIGWAVRSLRDSREHFEGLIGLQHDGTEEFPTVTVDFYDIGNCLLELLEPTGQDDTATFLHERGEGIHHLAFEVSDVQDALEAAAARGMRVIDHRPRAGARNTLIGFVDPGRTDRVLIEYVQSAQSEVRA